VQLKLRSLKRTSFTQEDEKAFMSNTMTIENQSSQETFAVDQPLPPKAELAAPQVPQELQVTEKAIKRIRAVLAKEGISSQEGGLRLGVIGGGCSGLSYSIKFDTRPRERDRIYEFGGVRIFVDPKSFLYLHGMTVDYEETLMRQGFTFINPNSTRSCGCGTSFSV
jgi:iron-sulfur cluster assembly protein